MQVGPFSAGGVCSFMYGLDHRYVRNIRKTHNVIPFVEALQSVGLLSCTPINNSHAYHRLFELLGKEQEVVQLARQFRYCLTAACTPSLLTRRTSSQEQGWYSSTDGLLRCGRRVEPLFLVSETME